MSRVFVSHASADAALVDELVDLVLRGGCGLEAGHLFYSSGADTRAPAGSGLIAHVREALSETALVVAIITPTFLTRPVCIAELGAAWVCNPQSLIPLLVPGLDHADLDGVLEGMTIYPLDDGGALDELHDRVHDAIGVAVATTTWGRYRGRWLNRVADLAAQSCQSAGRIGVGGAGEGSPAPPEGRDGQWRLNTLALAAGGQRRPVTVAFVGTSRDEFVENLFDGCRAALEHLDDVELIRPTSGEAGLEPADEELSVLRGLSPEIDALIFRPSGQLAVEQFAAVRGLARRGLGLVLLGDGVPDALFTAAGLRPPLRVHTPARAGAKILVEELARRMSTDEYRSLILLAGPAAESPELEITRVAAAAYLLGVRGVPFRILERRSGRPGEIARLFEDAGLLTEKRVLVSVNSDGFSLKELAIFLDERDAAETVDLVSYGGAIDASGELVASRHGAVATVDVRPRERGRVAANALAGAIRSGDPGDLVGALPIRPAMRR